jgi:glycosyltransferase involved in cell wall biosynthesis
MPWLLWGFDRQEWCSRELVIVDSSQEPFDVGGRTDVRVVHVPPATGIAAKRNIALHEARGTRVAWFDDDDWQHPRRLSDLMRLLDDGATYAGATTGWFVSLTDRRCAPHRVPRGEIVFNSAVFDKDAVMPIPFREDLVTASDTDWSRAVAARHQAHRAILPRDDLFFWLCHRHNISNRVGARRLLYDLAVLRGRIGQTAWDDTDEQLAALRTRVESAASIRQPTRHSVMLSPPRSVQSTEPQLDGSAPAPAVGLMVKATVLDAPYLDVMVRHMAAQACYSFAERVIVVDRPPAFGGKYAARPQVSPESLDAVLDGLLRDGVIDEVRHVDPSPAVQHEITSRYFATPAQVPTHSVTGGPIYATLFGLESMRTDYILQMDADILFYTGEGSWVSRALACLMADRQLWMVMTHPGPPCGPPARSLGWQQQAHARWDNEMQLWRFRHATTRYFLCDRRRLRDRVPIVRRASGCAPLEQCLSAALQQNDAYRANLGDLSSWHLHVWYHGAPFPEWASALASTVEAGLAPECQRGQYDLRLDRAFDRAEWSRLLAPQRRPEAGRPHAETPTVAHRPPMPAACAPISVVIPVRDRAGQRLRNALRGLHWQESGSPAEILIVSHGSRPEVDADLQRLCEAESVTLLLIGEPSHAWNKPLALNTGIRHSSPDVPFLMTMDADMVLSPNFLSVVTECLSTQPPSLVLCRISDLPPQAEVPSTRDDLLRQFEHLLRMTSLRPRFGSGGIQAACREFFFRIRGYDEDFAWWGAMDGDLVNRARLAGLDLTWIENRAAMLHQWHPRKHAVLRQADQIQQARRAWQRNHQIMRLRARSLQRNPNDWGGQRDSAPVPSACEVPR